MGSPIIRKVSIAAAETAGGETDYWEGQWVGELRVFRGRVRALLEQHLPVGGRVLEAGCGQGQVAVGLRDAGFDVVGIDLARSALAALRGRQPDLPLVIGDVGDLPFPDASFDAVVSLGVVEHFEAGPVHLLADHARVLADDGILFLTVPARNWYRRWSDLRHLGPSRSGSYPYRDRIVSLRREAAPEPDAEHPFHQYEYPRTVIEGFCREAGLEVLEWKPFGVARALGDSALTKRLARQMGGGSSREAPRSPEAPAGPSASAAPSASSSPSSSSGGLFRRAKGFLRQAVIEEEGTGVLGHAISWTVTHALGHNQLLIARRAR